MRFVSPVFNYEPLILKLVYFRGACLPVLLCSPRVAEALAEAQAATCCVVGKPLAADGRRCRQAKTKGHV